MSTWTRRVVGLVGVVTCVNIGLLAGTYTQIVAYERAVAGRAERTIEPPPRAEAPPAPRTALDCVQTTGFDARNAPVHLTRPMDRLEAEVWLHAAETYIRAAQHYAGAPAMAQARALVALAILQYVRACWSGQE